ncbi:hypothetical protein R5R35_000582 [Gryllus longicercus]|uniref:Glycosyl transferase CAP10 domain-containing protein n=1 Tax=Gryllus longicercus TaxID=2509291 RepID=A0AAN9VPM0_9ORTH
MYLLKSIFFNIAFTLMLLEGINCEVDPQKCVVWGPGLHPERIVLPARYFFISTVDSNGVPFSKSPGNIFSVHITGTSKLSNKCSTWMNILDRKDGTFIVRYKMYHACENLKIQIKYNKMDVADSPYVIPGPVYPEHCYCPEKNFENWQESYGCKRKYRQIEEDLKHFTSVNFSFVQEMVLSKFNNPRSTSICHYIVRENKVFRNCYGQHVGFKMFMDEILLSLSRKVELPDVEMFVNLGDWPLIKNSDANPLPMFSWCGSDDTLDIVMPTYDITESTLECMGRVTLDMLSVQGNIDKSWNEKLEKAFWRGRDSRIERLKLIEIAREHPELFNASMTNFFFFREEMEKYGPKEQHVSFFKFFDYKYQVNIDGTVAAYRFPYLLAGDSLVLKQESKYYEHFYKELEPWKHYIPFKRDLSDLVEQVLWAKGNDEKAKQIAAAAQTFARENLLPQDIICYHALLFKEWSKRLSEPVKILDGMDHVPQPSKDSPHKQCSCHRQFQNINSHKEKDEL